MTRTLRQLISSDLADDKLFFNIDGFAEQHEIDGKQIAIIVDDDELVKRKITGDVELDESTMLIKLRRKDFARRLTHGDRLNFDGRFYTVDRCTEMYGMITVAMHESRS